MVSSTNKKLKNGIFIPIIAIFLITISLVSCQKKPSQQEILQENIRQAVREYMEMGTIDSVYIQDIDTVSSLGYAIMMKQALENMQMNYEYEYKEAIFENNEIQILEIELSISEIEYMIEYFDLLMRNEQLKQDDLLLLWITSEIEFGGQRQHIDFLTNPDGTLHIPDPFGNNLLDEEFAAN